MGAGRISGREGSEITNGTSNGQEDCSSKQSFNIKIWLNHRRKKKLKIPSWIQSKSYSCTIPPTQDAEAIEMRDFKAYLSYEFKASLRSLTKACNQKKQRGEKVGYYKV